MALNFFRIWCLLIAGCVALALAFACKPPKAVAKEPVEQTAFFTIELRRDSVSQKTSATIKTVNVVDQKIRYIVDEGQSRNPYFLKIVIEYRDGKMVTGYTEHPLYKRLEIYSESGKIESKLISLSQGEVTLRVPYFENYKKVTIVENVNFKEEKPIVLKHEK